MTPPDEQVASLSRDPFTTLASLRGDGTVQEGEIMALLGTTLPSSTGLDLVQGDSFSVFGYEAARKGLRDGSVFSSASTSAGLLFGRTILEMDEPEHRTYRSLISSAFSRREMERWQTELVVPELRALIVELRSQGAADLVADLTFPFPIRIIARLLGLPAADRDRFHRWAITALDLDHNVDQAQREEATTQLVDYLHAILNERRADPSDDMISLLATSEISGQQLTDDEIVSFIRLLLPAGSETTYRASGTLLYGLLTNPGQLDAVNSDRTLIGAAIEESLRWEPPIMAIGRTPLRDVTLDHCEIPAGSAVHFSIGAANRDPSIFVNPDQFDIFRSSAPHLAFAAGPHTCIGMHLARMEVGEILKGVLDGLPNVRLDPEAGDAHITGIAFRSPTHVPVIWDA